MGKKKAMATIRTSTEQKFHLTSLQMKDAILDYIEKHAEMYVAVGEGDVTFEQASENDDTGERLRCDAGEKAPMNRCGWDRGSLQLFIFVAIAVTLDIDPGLINWSLINGFRVDVAIPSE